MAALIACVVLEWTTAVPSLATTVVQQCMPSQWHGVQQALLSGLSVVGAPAVHTASFEFAGSGDITSLCMANHFNGTNPNSIITLSMPMHGLVNQCIATNPNNISSLSMPVQVSSYKRRWRLGCPSAACNRLPSRSDFNWHLALIVLQVRVTTACSCLP